MAASVGRGREGGEKSSWCGLLMQVLGGSSRVRLRSVQPFVATRNPPLSSLRPGPEPPGCRVRDAIAPTSSKSVLGPPVNPAHLLIGNNSPRYPTPRDSALEIFGRMSRGGFLKSAETTIFSVRCTTQHLQPILSIWQLPTTLSIEATRIYYRSLPLAPHHEGQSYEPVGLDLQSPRYRRCEAASQPRFGGASVREGKRVSLAPYIFIELY